MESSKKTTENSENTKNEEKPGTSFKKPILIGKIGHLPRKIQQMDLKKSEEKTLEKEDLSVNVEIKPEKQVVEPSQRITKASVQQMAEQNIPLPYKEPNWSGLPESCEKEYVFEVLKNGSIIETINLMKNPFWIFGRMANCHISMQHPTISRYHAVLQYRSTCSETEEPGFYIYDLGSTHGTFLNKNRLKPKVYARIQVGHMLKLGCSTRSYILNGPENDTEEESELTVTELKQKRAEELRLRAEEARDAEVRAEKEREERRRKEEERGVDWGLGEDADEEEDLSENPYAQTNNEELYLDDPKKALRGFFEREGLDLEYDCTEQGMGQFLCKVELPIDDDMGRPIVAEALHRGKKKEAVVHCALEACRILDRHGVLRQATHESRKRKAKNWEENDYYDSDDDTFLDRTGTVEKKREMRMKSKLPPKAETYESLLEKEKFISSSIADLEKQLAAAQKKLHSGENSNNEEDSLDTFMKELKQSKPDKQTVSKLKLELTKLKTEHSSVIKLVNIAKPASLPPLEAHYASGPSTSKEVKHAFPVIGKRKKIKVQLPERPTQQELSIVNSNMEVEEEEEKEEDHEDSSKEEENRQTKEESSSKRVDNGEEYTEEIDAVESSSSSEDEREASSEGVGEFRPIKSFHETMTFKKFEKILKKGLPPFADKHQEKLEKILNNLKKLAANEERMHVDWKMLAAKKRKVMKLISDLRTCEPNEKLEHKVSSELNRILNELNIMTEQKYKVIGKVKKMGDEIKNISEAIDKDFKEFKKEMAQHLEENEEKPNTSTSSSSDKDDKSEECNEKNAETDDKKKKKNQRRIQQRQGRTELERQRGYEEDATRDDYNMWVPPSNQLGDGRTSLNDKYGY